MEIAFAGGAFAEVASYDSCGDVGVLESLQFERVSGASGLRDLGCEGRGDCVLSFFVRVSF